MSKLNQLSLHEAKEGMIKKKFSSREITQDHIKAIKNCKNLNAFITEIPDLALQAADESDKRRTRGEAGIMEGLPIAVKDLFCTKGILTTAASRMLENFTPTYESTVTQNLLKSGAIFLGKTNLDEFAMGSSNTTSYFKPTQNPWRGKDKEKILVPGGSSGGSAVAVSTRLALGATGTDTGGSIRQPAAFCGIVGMKPTYGRCSRWGIIAFASSLDQAGPITRNVRDSAIMLRAMAGYDRKDSTSINKNVPDYESGLGKSIKGLTVGIPKQYRIDGMNPDLAKLWDMGIEWLKSSGVKISEISLSHTKYALPTYYIIAPAEASSNLARYDGVRYGFRSEATKTFQDMYEKTRAEAFGDEVKRRIFIGTYVLSAGYYDAYYLKAQKVRKLIADDFHQAFDKVDAILTPTTPGSAFGIGEKMDDPIAMYLNDVLTVPASLAGLPAISVPAGLDQENLPIGLQVIGKPFDEQTVFQVAEVIEKSSGINFDPNLVNEKNE